MPPTANSLDHLVTMLVPSLANSLAEQFNVFQVMHHGTHEKQLSNVFAWLLNADGTHELGDTFQRLFVEHVNRQLPVMSRLPVTDYDVAQEVDTSGLEGHGKDIADIVLTSDHARLVVENFEWSDGHGHGYERYLAYGASGGRQGVVVLLCVRHVRHLQKDGWENAVVVTYGELLESLQAYIARDGAWRHAHPRQGFFIGELVRHYTEGPAVVNVEDQIEFLKAMCDTGESARYGHRPLETAAQQFADRLALHAKKQFEEGRQTLATVKTSLRRHAEASVAPQLNTSLTTGRITAVQAPFRGQWEWYVALRRADDRPSLFLTFGPTAVVENGLVAESVTSPDYTKIFVTRQAPDGEGIDRIAQTAVGLDEVLSGLSAEDFRLRDALLAIGED